MTPEPAIDFDLLDLDVRQASALNRRALRWLTALLLLVALSIGGLVAFLFQAEAQEEARRDAADAEWLDQTLRFHFRRLEADLALLARREVPQGDAAVLERAGQLWRGQGVVVHHAWLDAAAQPFAGNWPAQWAPLTDDPAQAGAIAVMLDTARGLRRPAYAGPLPSPDGSAHWLWLAVPAFSGERFVGSYVAVIHVGRALEQAVPGWFLQEHALRSIFTTGHVETNDAGERYTVPVNLPGAQWTLGVRVLQAQPARAPRVFFAVALVCLLSMSAALYWLARDASRRRRAEARLQSQVALRTAMERAVTLGLCAWGGDGRLLYANHAFARLLGREPADVARQTVEQPWWPLATPPGQNVPPEGLEQRWTRPDGEYLDVLVHAAPMAHADGRVAGWMASALDVTERRRIERLAASQQEKLEASARLVAVGEVASTLAHELNQPLGALSGFANGLLNRVREGSITLEQAVPVVERMERIAQKAGRVIQRVNAFARRQEMAPQATDLSAFVQRVAGQLTLPPGVSLTLQLPSHPVSVPADALLLEHAVHNLVLNATEWAPRGVLHPARVRVTLEEQELQAVLLVEDSGPGVAPEDAASIFEAFHTRKPGGMGMGLSICRSIVEAHHGRLEVGRSTELGGAQFTLWLPKNP